MRPTVPISLLVLSLAAACGGKIAHDPATGVETETGTGTGTDTETDADADAAREVDVTPGSIDDSVVACKRPRAARIGHTCSTSCATASSSDRAFSSPDELLDFLQTRWIACTDNVGGFPANGIAFHDGCSFSWLIDGRESLAGTFSLGALGPSARTATIELHAAGVAGDRLVIAMSACPNQLRITRGSETTYLMAE
jgi:hypothetical protein